MISQKDNRIKTLEAKLKNLSSSENDGLKMNEIGGKKDQSGNQITVHNPKQR